MGSVGPKAQEAGDHGVGIHLNREGNSGTVMVREQRDGKVVVEIYGDQPTIDRVEVTKEVAEQ